MATLAKDASAGQPTRCELATSLDTGSSHSVAHCEALGGKATGSFAPATTIRLDQRDVSADTMARPSTTDKVEDPAPCVADEFNSASTAAAIPEDRGRASHVEAKVEGAVAQMAALDQSIDDGTSTQSTTAAQAMQTAAQRVLNLPDLLEPILLSVAAEDVRAWWYYLKNPKTVLLAQRVNKTWQNVIQESTPIKQALWLEHDDKVYIGLSVGTHWNPIIWPEPPRSSTITFDRKWIRRGLRSKQSWSKMIMAKSTASTIWVKVEYPDFRTWKCNRVEGCRVGKFIDTVKAEVRDFRNHDYPQIYQWDDNQRFWLR